MARGGYKHPSPAHPGWLSGQVRRGWQAPLQRAPASRENGRYRRFPVEPSLWQAWAGDHQAFMDDLARKRESAAARKPSPASDLGSAASAPVRRKRDRAVSAADRFAVHGEGLLGVPRWSSVCARLRRAGFASASRAGARLGSRKPPNTEGSRWWSPLIGLAFVALRLTVAAQRMGAARALHIRGRGIGHDRLLTFNPAWTFSDDFVDFFEGRGQVCWTMRDSQSERSNTSCTALTTSTASPDSRCTSTTTSPRSLTS